MKIDEVEIQINKPISDEEIVARLKALDDQPEETVADTSKLTEQPAPWDMRKLQGMDELPKWEDAKNGLGKMYEEVETDPLTDTVTWEEAQSGVKAAWDKESKKQLEARRQAKLKMLGFTA